MAGILYNSNSFDEDVDSGLVDETCAVWSLRFFALAFLIAGSKGVQVYRTIDELICKRAPAIVVFWEALRFAGGIWLVFDVTACCFFLRLSWLRRRIERLGRMFSCTAWVFCIFGLTQYSMQLGTRQWGQCYSVGGVFVMLALILACVTPLLWWALIDCDNMCSNCGEAGHDACCGACFELTAWPAAEEPAEEALGDLEFARPSASASLDARPPRKKKASRGTSKRSRTAASSSSSGSVGSAGRAGPAVVGRSRLPPGPRRSAAAVAEGTIRVMREGRVLHVGTTRRGVKRWVEDHLDDDRGVTIEDSTEMGILPSRQVARPASPESSPSPPGSPPDADDAVGSEPPSPALSPRGLGLEDSDSDAPMPMFAEFGRGPGSQSALRPAGAGSPAVVRHHVPEPRPSESALRPATVGSPAVKRQLDDNWV
mmetsp:Transcript_27179/g.49508  ORF Transcript_27179/g.49508 Transcript_27179/m.49508 type:complete len:427 (-) Transcript_27179:16-1296(-)